MLLMVVLLSNIVFGLLRLLIGRTLLSVMVMVIVVLASASVALLLDALLVVLVHLYDVASV